jgi:hypothetical protein
MQHICSRYATKILICIGHFSVEITGVLDNIRNKQELMNAMGILGWHTGGEENE